MIYDSLSSRDFLLSTPHQKDSLPIPCLKSNAHVGMQACPLSTHTCSSWSIPKHHSLGGLYTYHSSPVYLGRSGKHCHVTCGCMLSRWCRCWSMHVHAASAGRAQTYDSRTREGRILVSPHMAGVHHRCNCTCAHPMPQHACSGRSLSNVMRWRHHSASGSCAAARVSRRACWTRPHRGIPLRCHSHDTIPSPQDHNSDY